MKADEGFIEKRQMLSFLSSTFVNMKEERNALQMDIVIPL